MTDFKTYIVIARHSKSTHLIVKQLRQTIFNLEAKDTFKCEKFYFMDFGMFGIETLDHKENAS